MGVSIIIPCYNCEKTLEAAVNSIYRQNLKEFEVIMIDDKSTDSTRAIMKKISDKKSEVKLFYNENNIGGGATRNRAVAESSNEIIFCLDSDDILGDGTLKKMLDFILDKKCEAIGLSTSIKFKKDSKENVSYVSNFGYVNEIIPVKSLFEKNTCPLYSVCMFKKEPFTKFGGYPENHGFDTQGFAFRFLLNGFIAYTCPDSVYYHRVDFNKSYYLREYEAGKINHNWYKVFEEFLYIFEEDNKELILNFDLNNPNKNLYNEIQKSNKILKNDFNKITPNKDNINDIYWIALSNFKKENYKEAQKLFEVFIKNNNQNYYAHFYLKECIQKTKEASSLLDEDKIKKLFLYKKQGSSVNFFVRVFRKILRNINETF